VSEPAAPHPVPPARVIINADDFGLHPVVNGAIAQGHRDGLITSASLMTLGSACEDAVRLARTLPTLDLGLHFCLVGVPGLPAGLGPFAAACLRGQFPANRIAEELRRQLAYAHSAGLGISHIDAHQHLHALPWVMRIVCRVAAEYDIPGIRLPLDGPALAAIPSGRRVQAAALRISSRLSRRYILETGRRTTDHFAGMAVSGHLIPRTLASYLEQARPGTTEIVCHPGADDRILRSLYDWGYDWEGELAAVTHADTKKIVHSGTVKVISWQGI
jgi:predicted glycoside hydrolase/deacetylase ChbG (UPF0249 family)